MSNQKHLNKKHFRLFYIINYSVSNLVSFLLTNAITFWLSNFINSTVSDIISFFVTNSISSSVGNTISSTVDAVINNASETVSDANDLIVDYFANDTVSNLMPNSTNCSVTYTYNTDDYNN